MILVLLRRWRDLSADDALLGESVSSTDEIAVMSGVGFD